MCLSSVSTATRKQRERCASISRISVRVMGRRGIASAAASMAGSHTSELWPDREPRPPVGARRRACGYHHFSVIAVCAPRRQPRRRHSRQGTAGKRHGEDGALLAREARARRGDTIGPGGISRQRRLARGGRDARAARCVGCEGFKPTTCAPQLGPQSPTACRSAMTMASRHCAAACCMFSDAPAASGKV